MRILSILASPAPGGAEILVRNLSTEFARGGNSAHILFMSDAAGVGNPEPFERELLDSLDEAGVTHEFMPRGCFGNPLRAAASLTHTARKFEADVIHTHLARGALCRSFSPQRLPTVYTHHNVVANFPTILFRLFDLRVDRYVAIGTACEAFLAQHVRGPITQIPNGVPAAFAAETPRRRIARDPTILAVGALAPKKDYANLVAAAAAVIPRFRAEGRTARFAIVGEGPERPMLEALIAREGLGSEIELLGARRDVAELMRRADLLINSSAHEGLPITLIEAAMSGLPIVATNVGGNAEVVLDGRSGFIVPPGQPQALADRIHDLLSDEPLYAACSEAALGHSGKFAIGACAAAHLALYASLIPMDR